jgi:Type I site-specific restriction-modification system, R (restriction) subunit and related helicases
MPIGQAERQTQLRLLNRAANDQTQGSGKSLTMVWLAKWIREHMTDARVLIITDRTEFDEQIEKIFKGVNEAICRSKSGADLIHRINSAEDWLLCSLHKAMKAILPHAIFIGFTGAPAQGRQAKERRGLRGLYSHLQIQRGGTRWRSCWTCATRPTTSIWP